MLTGSGVALILRSVATEPGDHWTWVGWHIFACWWRALSLLTKYLIRFRGSHVFNPSNIGLVVAFLVLGSDRIEPLDFWWGPLDGWLVLAYAVILGGGLLITSRLRLLAMAATFWLALAAGLGVLAASGHCITAAWALRPGLRLDVLVGGGHLARGPHLPLLHDHRPEDHPGRGRRPGALRRGDRRAEHRC